MRTWVFVLVLLFLAPTGLASPATTEGWPGIQNPANAAPTTMFVHLGLPQDYPINTQQPDDRYGVSQGQGFTTTTNTCVPDEVPGLVRGDRHSWYGYSSPGYVHYDVDMGGSPRIHPERGLSYNIDFDTDKPIRLVWYVESQYLSNDINVNSAPSITPNVALRATFREGDAISVGHEALNIGRIIAQATTTPALLVGPATPDHPQVTYMPITQDGETKHVYEFALDVPFDELGRSPQIKAVESYNLRIDLYMENPQCADPGSEEKLMPNTVRLHSSVGHRPRFTWDVEQAVRIESLHPQFIGDELIIHTSANSPWGNYDVRGDQPSENGSYNIEVTGPSVPVNLHLGFFDAATLDHDHHTDAVAASWIWPYKAESARPGIYTVTLRVSNDQETAQSVAIAKFEIGEHNRPICSTGADGTETCDDPIGPTNPTPAAPIGLLMLALGTLAVSLRRRT